MDMEILKTFEGLSRIILGVITEWRLCVWGDGGGLLNDLLSNCSATCCSRSEVCRKKRLLWRQSGIEFTLIKIN